MSRRREPIVLTDMGLIVCCAAFVVAVVKGLPLLLIAFGA